MKPSYCIFEVSNVQKDSFFHPRAPTLILRWTYVTLVVMQVHLPLLLMCSQEDNGWYYSMHTRYYGTLLVYISLYIQKMKSYIRMTTCLSHLNYIAARGQSGSVYQSPESSKAQSVLCFLCWLSCAIVSIQVQYTNVVLTQQDMLKCKETNKQCCFRKTLIICCTFKFTYGFFRASFNSGYLSWFTKFQTQQISSISSLTDASGFIFRKSDGTCAQGFVVLIMRSCELRSRVCYIVSTSLYLQIQDLWRKVRMETEEKGDKAIVGRSLYFCVGLQS